MNEKEYYAAKSTVCLNSFLQADNFFKSIFPTFSVLVVLYRVIQDHNEESNYNKQEAEKANWIPDKAYSFPTFSPGYEYRSLKYCGNNHTGEGQDKNEYDVKDLSKGAFFCHLFCLLNRST
ncbi:hypothetical protein BGV40_16870 [Methanosarcina sp. Ant1]|nr:hypothetical protein BGV40_16870 [Methanosarcina sp. Ant1]